MPSNMPFILSAYIITWVVLLGYVVHLRRVRQDAERRLSNAMFDASGGEK